jgi:hypothetical protein
MQLARTPSGNSVTVRTVNEAAQQIAFSDRYVRCIYILVHMHYDDIH